MKVITGAWQYSDGTPVAGGSVWLKLPQDAVALGTAQIAPQWVRKILDSTGSLPVNTLIWFTDELSPAQLTYTVSVVAPGGGLVWGAELVPITGASFNLNNAIPTTLNILLANPVITNPTSIQTINSFALADTVGFQAGVGSVSAPSYTFIGDLNTGMYDAAADDIRFSTGGTDGFRIDGTAPTVPAGRPLAWGSAGVTSRDAGFSRLGTSSLAVGNGTQGDITGTLSANLFKSVTGIQQQSAVTAFSILDNLGISHFFISGSSPFINTFIQGNGTGSTFIGTGNFAVSIPDNSNTIVFKGLTSGTATLVPVAIVGTTVINIPSAGTDTMAITNGAQTFLNKTLTGATTGNNVTVINAQGSVGPLTGNSADQVIYTFSIPANTIDTNSKSISLRCGLVHTTGTANTTIKVSLNGVNIMSGTSGTAASQSIMIDIEVLRTGTTTAGTSGNFGAAVGASGAFSVAATGLAWTSNQTIAVTFNVANTDTWSGLMNVIKQNQ